MPRRTTSGHGGERPTSDLRSEPESQGTIGLRRFVRRHPAVSILCTLFVLGLVPPAVWTLLPPAESQRGRQSAPDPRYASQGSSAQRVREQHVRARRDQDVSAAVETCAAVGLDRLAQAYELPRSPRRVATQFAKSYEPAYQLEIRRACLHGLEQGG
jgi:hypothetical protein